MHSRRILLLIFLILTPVSVRAENYYVSFISSLLAKYKKPIEVVGITSTVVVSAYVTYRVIDSFFNWLCKKDERPRITVGKAKVVGSQMTMHGQLVKQIVPFHQTGSTCGYHSVLNSILIANECLREKGQLAYHLDSNKYTKKLIDKGGLWRSYIQKSYETNLEEMKQANITERVEEYKTRHNQDPSPSMLSQIRIWAASFVSQSMQGVYSDQELYEDQIKDLFLLETGSKKINGRADINYAVLDKNISENQFGCTVVNRSDRNNKNFFDAAINKIKHVKGPYVHAFVINTADQYESKTGDFGSHWIAHVVFKKADSTIEHIIADSLTTNTLSNAFGNAIVNMILDALS